MRGVRIFAIRASFRDTYQGFVQRGAYFHLEPAFSHQIATGTLIRKTDLRNNRGNAFSCGIYIAATATTARLETPADMTDVLASELDLAWFYSSGPFLFAASNARIGQVRTNVQVDDMVFPNLNPTFVKGLTSPCLLGM